MTDDEKKQYELARLGIARLMGDASEADKWAKAVSQTRAGEQRHAPVPAEQETACAWDNVASPDFDGCNGCDYACALGHFKPLGRRVIPRPVLPPLAE